MKTAQYTRQEKNARPALRDLDWYVKQERKIQAHTRSAAEGRRLLQRITDAGHLYVIEFASGVVKVGRSTSPSRRLGKHAEAAGIYGVELTNSWVSKRHHNHTQTERKLIRFCTHRGELVSGKEYFRIPFAEARMIADALAGAELRSAELERRVDRDRERREYLESLIAAASNDMSMTWQDAHERLGGDPL